MNTLVNLQCFGSWFEEFLLAFILSDRVKVYRDCSGPLLNHCGPKPCSGESLKFTIFVFIYICHE